MAKTIRNGLSMIETNPLNHNWSDFEIQSGLALHQFKKKTAVKWRIFTQPGNIGTGKNAKYLFFPTLRKFFESKNISLCKEEFLNSSGVGVQATAAKARVVAYPSKGHEFAFGARSFVTYSFVS